MVPPIRGDGWAIPIWKAVCRLRLSFRLELKDRSLGGNGVIYLSLCIKSEPPLHRALSN